MKKIIILTILVLGLVLVGCTKISEIQIKQDNENKQNSTEKKTSEPRLGGACEYDNYSGSCKIVSINELNNLPGDTEPKYLPQYEVRYRFIPDDEDMIDAPGMSLLNTDIKWGIGSSNWNVGPEYMEKYNIELNKVFNCVYKKIVRGTCTPGIIDIEGLNKYDYFEVQKYR